MRTIFSPIFMVRQYERGIIETFGKYSGFLTPGLNFQIPFVNTAKTRDIREHTMEIDAQPVITKDNVEIIVDGIIWASPKADEENIKKTFYNIDNWKAAILQLAMTNLRQEFGNLTLDESLISRESISENLFKSLNHLSVDWGLEVSKVEIKLIDPPQDIKTAMHKQKTAEQERRAMKLLATGQYEAAEQEKLAAIQKAEGEKEARIRVAEGKAKAIELENEAAEKYFKGNAQQLKQLEVTQASLERNAKIIIAKDGINPQIILGNIPTDSSNS